MLRRLLKWLDKPFVHGRIMRSPDRVLLVREMLPVFAGQGPQVLWVGVKRYTRTYAALLAQKGAICWTTDISAKVARWGAPGRHVTADLLEIDRAFAPGQFSTVLCNGVFGFGVDTAEAQRAAFQAMAKILAPGGWLLLGWNTDRIADPLADAAWRRWFEPGALEGLPPRRRIAGTTHVYDLLRRRPD